MMNFGDILRWPIGLAHLLRREPQRPTAVARKPTAKTPVAPARGPTDASASVAVPTNTSDDYQRGCRLEAARWARVFTDPLCKGREDAARMMLAGTNLGPAAVLTVLSTVSLPAPPEDPWARRRAAYGSPAAVVPPAPEVEAAELAKRILDVAATVRGERE